MFHTYNLHLLMQSYTFLSYHVSFQIIYIFLLVLINMYLSLFTHHHMAVLCFSYYVLSYTFIIFESFAYTYHLFYVSCLIISHILFMSSCTLLLILVIVYYHRITMLCFSYHVMSCTLSFLNHLHILFICFMFHACINLRSG